MRRDAAWLSAAAERVSADLVRTTNRPWTCDVGSDYVLTVSDGVIGERLLLESEVEDEEWFAPVGATAAELDAGLDADADELLSSEVAEALRSLGVEWPVCADHRRAMISCSGSWICNGEPSHDVAEVGSLQAAQVL